MSILRDAIAKKSEVESQLPVSGIVRLGIKQITKSASLNPKVLGLFNKALAGDITMKQAELEAVKENVKYPFFPTNTQHFNVHPLEVEGGRETVNNLLQLYGEDRGDGLKIYRFPVIFPDVPNGIDGVFKSKFAVQQGPTKYSSEYTDAGQRICVYREPIDKAKQASRKKFVAREKKVRGACDPATCGEFGAGACRFQGTLHFYVPGVTGSGTWILKTGSTYASEDVFLRLDDLYRRCNGRLPNFTPDGHPVFALTKTLKTMKWFDESGAERKSEQWVLSLETVIDMSKVMLLEERKRFALAAPSATPDASSVPKVWLAQAPSDVTPQHLTAQAVESAEKKPSAGNAPPDAKSTGSTGDPSDTELDQINNLVSTHDIGDEVEEWAALKFGDDWFDQPAKITLVLSEISEQVSKMGPDFVKEFLPLVSMMYEYTLFPKELGIPYVRAKFNLKVKEQRQAAYDHIQDLLKHGSVVAKQMMTEFMDANRQPSLV